jgi:hypothetical protein
MKTTWCKTSLSLKGFLDTFNAKAITLMFYEKSITVKCVVQFTTTKQRDIPSVITTPNNVDVNDTSYEIT